jgi:hypothetical protein
MVGNAAEWLNHCISWKDKDQTVCTKALVAGGSHQDTASKIRKDIVSAVPTQKTSKAIGLRLVLEL